MAVLGYPDFVKHKRSGNRREVQSESHITFNLVLR